MREKGFTLIEMMISLFIGGLILGGVMFTYIGMKVTTKEHNDNRRVARVRPLSH
ncbi:type II secretion system protein [Pseudoalteromonas sp. Hal099]